MNTSKWSWRQSGWGSWYWVDPAMKRILIASAISATIALSSCGTSNTTPPAPEGSSPDVTALVLDSTDTTINGRVAPDANGNNNDATRTSAP